MSFKNKIKNKDTGKYFFPFCNKIVETRKNTVRAREVKVLGDNLIKYGVRM
jgi:hypothetical protein